MSDFQIAERDVYQDFTLNASSGQGKQPNNLRSAQEKELAPPQRP